MPSHCSVDALAAFVGGTLVGSQVRQVEAHLDACERCRKFMSALVRTNDEPLRPVRPRAPES